MAYDKIEEPCFVCEIEDKMNQSRGTQSHPINCGWYLRRASEGYEKGLAGILKICDTSIGMGTEELVGLIKSTAMSAMVARYDIKEEHIGKVFDYYTNNGELRDAVCTGVEFHPLLGKSIFIGVSPFGHEVRLTRDEINSFREASSDGIQA